MRRLVEWTLTVGAIALSTWTPSIAQPPASAPPLENAKVASIYATYHMQPLWFRGGQPSTAIAQLITILQRSAFDGLADGPRLATQIEAAVERASSGKPADVIAADQFISAAWIGYVHALKRPTTGMLYGVEALRPHPPAAETILLTAAHAPSLAEHLIATSRLNAQYALLRDTAWAEALASGNPTPDPRILVNLDRARSIPSAGRFIVVDSATQLLTLYENGQPVDTMKVIVGTKQLPTPLISSIIYYVTFNPYWHAPDHLVRKTIAPNFLRLGPKYFQTRGYEILSDWSDPASTVDPSSVDWKAAARGDLHLLIRQAPGRWNSMGKLKFPFPNSEDIYLHDTPGKELFAKDTRNLSNGCVRVEDAARLGRWLLARDPIPPGSDPEIAVPVPQAVPIVLTYLTAQVRDGKVIYLPDIYGWDGAGMSPIVFSQ